MWWEVRCKKSITFQPVTDSSEEMSDAVDRSGINHPGVRYCTVYITGGKTGWKKREIEFWAVGQHFLWKSKLVSRLLCLSVSVFLLCLHFYSKISRVILLYTVFSIILLKLCHYFSWPKSKSWNYVIILLLYISTNEQVLKGVNSKK